MAAPFPRASAVFLSEGSAFLLTFAAVPQHTIRGSVSYFGSGAGAMKHSGVNKQYEGLRGVVRCLATIRSPRPRAQ